MLKTICPSDEAMTLIVESVIIGHGLETDTIDMHDLSGFHKLINNSNLNAIAFLDFATYHRKNLAHEKLSRSPMHNLFLGKNNALVIN